MVQEEELTSEFNGKVARNDGLNNGFLQFLTSRDRFRYICQKPPENAWVGENKPIKMHWKTLKWDFLQNSSIELAEIENM